MDQSIKWDSLTPLNQNNEDYEPDQQEIQDYAIYIGINLPQDQRYLPIAKEGLKASLPPFWQACEDPNGQLYFRNRKTRQISDTNPLDVIYRKKIEQLKQLEATYQFDVIKQESMLNESSGVVRSRVRASEVRQYQKENIDQHQVLQNHITEESVYSDKPSKTDKQQSNTYQPQWLRKRRNMMSQIVKKIQKFVPTRKDLITNFQKWEQSEGERLQRVMGDDRVKKLAELRQQAERKRNKLKQLQMQRKQLEKLLDQSRGVGIM